SIFLTPPEGGSQARLDAAESTTQTTAPKPPPASSGVPARKARVLPFLLRHGDLVLVAVVTAAAFALSAHYNLSEALRHLTRPYEALQLDELPVVMLVAALGAVWFAWRRYREARRELRQRHAAEATLATTLEENRRLARRFMDMQEAERRTLARELHDELGQYLNAIKLDAVAIENHDPTPPMRGRARSIVDNIDHVHSVVQVLIRRFRPVALDELGLQAALEHYIDHWRRRLPHTALRLAISGDLEPCGEPANLAIYRIVQEGLTNISRHAQATQVRVQLERWTSERSGRDEVCLTIEDNGIGVASGARGSGLGLVGMRERAEALGGELRLSSAPGHGFSLTVKLPVVHEQRRP
ncbi:MAG: sensor histidine kinase, partial [Rhodanobacter sp.]